MNDSGRQDNPPNRKLRFQFDQADYPHVAAYRSRQRAYVENGARPSGKSPARPPRASDKFQPPVVQAHIHNHFPPATRDSLCHRQPLQKETLEQRMTRLQKEYDRKLFITRFLSLLLFLALAVATFQFWPNNQHLTNIRNTKVPLSTVIAFLAFLTFLHRIAHQYQHDISFSHSCQKAMKIFALVLTYVIPTFMFRIILFLLY